MNVEGIDRTDSPANRFLPPDTNGAAGADFYLQQVNVTFAVYNKVGQRVMGPTPQAALWAGFGGPCQTTGGGDGIVLYDRYANRFLFSKLAFPNGPAVGPFFQCISVSVTADPTGAWNRYQFLVSDTKFNDYPKFGVWPDGYYYTVNQFVNVRQPNERLAGVGAGVFERDKMLLGQRARLLLFDTEPLGLDIANMLPADADGPILPPAGSPNFLVNMKNMLLEDLESTIPQPVLQLWKLQVDWRQPQSSTFTGPDEIQTMDFDPIWNSDGCSDPMAFFPELCIPQPPAVGGLCTPNSCPNPDQKLDALQDRLMFRLQYRHSFDSTFGEFESLISNHTVNVGTDGVNRAGVHWWQLLQTPNKTWTVNQQDIIAPDDTDSRWMASAAMDEAENIVVGYTVSSPTRFPSVRYQGYDNGTIRRGETSLSDGTGAQGHPAGRWGDYSSMTLDPLDDCTFWYTQEYMRVTSRADWATRIGAFRFESCRQRNTR